MLLDMLLVALLVFIMPGKNLWANLREQSKKTHRAPMAQYLHMIWKPLVLTSMLGVVSMQNGYTLRDLGLDIPVSGAGLWGILAAILILAALAAGSYLSERKMTPRQREEAHEKMMASPIPWPTTPLESAANVISTTILTASWDILYRGFLLLVLAPWTGIPLAVIISSVAYGVAHGYISPMQMAMSIAMALLLTGAYAITGSLWWLIILHAGLPLLALRHAKQARAPYATARPAS